MLTFTTDRTWHDQHWEQVSPIFDASFPDSQRKSAEELHNLARKGIYAMHLAWSGYKVVGLAFTADLTDLNLLFLDYMAVAPDLRGQGIGRAILDYLAQWVPAGVGIVGELEIPEPDEPADAENNRRAAFYMRNGFHCLPVTLVLSPVREQHYYIIIRHPAALSLDPNVIASHIRAVHQAAHTPPEP